MKIESKSPKLRFGFNNQLIVMLLFMLPIIGESQPILSGPATTPVFQVDFPYPTADKPQSKIWYANKQWWALLPRANGPSLWQRTRDGWKEHMVVNETLRGEPGRADVWQDGNILTAVGVSINSFAIFRIALPGKSGVKSTAHVLARISAPSLKDSIETATIVQDGQKHWWVAADAGNSVYVWHSTDAVKWDQPVRLAEGIHPDDICNVTALPNSVMVIWSDQKRDGVFCREHVNGKGATDWNAKVTIQSGGLTADDHINTAVTQDGTIWAATKNSVDSLGKPQLVLRNRQKNGSWINRPYFNRQLTAEPSRPVVVVSPDGALFTGNTIYSKADRFADHIVFGQVEVQGSEVSRHFTKVIAPDAALKAKVNDITVSKKPFPKGGPWLILASDKEGRVYEADLRKFFGGK